RGRDVTARTYISAQGINGQMSASQKDGESYMRWLEERAEFAGIEFKIQPHHEHVFPRLQIKVKKELVAIGEELSFTERGEYVKPCEWSQMLVNDDDKVILDIRNDYEWKLGHFKGAEPVVCKTFKDFLDMAHQLKERLRDKPTKVMMYCTGGIRCEVFSALLKKEGMKNEIYQLHGGVIRYGEEEKAKHWRGKLFVFDDRLGVDLGGEKAEVIGNCHHCQAPIDNYYNCANLDCNELFLCCPSCLEKFRGCCKEECQSAERVRPFQYSHKPFRRWYNYVKPKNVSEIIQDKSHAAC
ncbi:MAG TPA: rhodanese-related sulfurtransferase, partial [Chlamydiales bacterium]|nr:rhodanese-related sulfurtransferase [Chlamydiales bacterium]